MKKDYLFKVDGFEGPLDLLLHLINKLEIDLYDIPVAEITEQYLTYVKTMQMIELNLASEYLVMAATLIALKSEMLLPKKETDDKIGEDEEDPREQLIKRLIEYRKYKEAAGQLQQQELEDKQTYTRSPMHFEREEDRTIGQGQMSIYDMVGALQKMLQRKEWQKPLDTRVSRIELSIDEKMVDIMSILRSSRERVVFEDLFTLADRSHLVTTFLALLQLMKENALVCEQESHFDPIYIYILEE